MNIRRYHIFSRTINTLFGLKCMLYLFHQTLLNTCAFNLGHGVEGCPTTLTLCQDELDAYGWLYPLTYYTYNLHLTLDYFTAESLRRG